MDCSPGRGVASSRYRAYSLTSASERRKCTRSAGFFCAFCDSAACSRCKSSSTFGTACDSPLTGAAAMASTAAAHTTARSVLRMEILILSRCICFLDGTCPTGIQYRIMALYRMLFVWLLAAALPAPAAVGVRVTLGLTDQGPTKWDGSAVAHGARIASIEG